MKKDSIYAEPKDTIEDFKFDNQVAEVFPDMIQRSVPGYRTLVSNIGVIAQSFCQPGSNVYDLGCSLGAATLSMAHRIKSADVHIYAIDNSKEMLQKARSSVNQEEFPAIIEFREADICELYLENASVVVLNFTLQFINPEKRLPLLKKIWEGMLPGGVLILSEKTADASSDIMNQLHLQFKRDQGYSELEISQKRTSLENVMIIDDIKEHRNRLGKAGFTQIDPWFQCFNFHSFMAVK